MVRKAVFATLSVIVLLAVLALPAMADSWQCPKCGQENTGNFCGNCGTPRPEAPAGEVTAPPEATFQPGFLLPSFITKPTPEPTPEPTAEPTPEPVRAVSGWVEDIDVVMDAGLLTVDYSDYAAIHPGQYYVLWEYLNNGYYSWFTMKEGATSQTFAVIPDQPLYVGVYCDTEGAGAPELDYDRMKPLIMPSEGFYMDHEFRSEGYTLLIEDDDMATAVPAFTLAEMRDQADHLVIGFDWAFSLSQDQRIDTLGVLTVPNGMKVSSESYFTWRAGTGGSYHYWLRSLLQRAANYDGVTEGEYGFDLYIDGCKAESIKFNVVADRSELAPTQPPVTQPPVTRPPVTQPPVTQPPVTQPPAVAAAEWVKDFSIFTEPGAIEVDFGTYAASHRGQYYVFYAYERNGYYSWYELDAGKTSQRITVVPGERIRVGVYCDPQAGGAPKMNEAAMKLLSLRTFGSFTSYGFKCATAEAVLNTDGAYRAVTAYSQSDVKNRAAYAMIRFNWSYSVGTDTPVTALGVLRAPDGSFYFQTIGYTLKDSGMTASYPLSTLLTVCDHRGALTQGDYVFELYMEGQRAASVSFRVSGQRALAVTPSPVPTKAPTPKPTVKPTPTKAPTPKPTRKPTEVPRTFRILTPSMSKGETTIRWEDSASLSPYTVTVQHRFTSGSLNKLAARQTFARNVYGKSASNGYVMAPGEPYTITVTDRNGKSVTYDYKPTLQIYPDFKISIDVDLKTLTPNGSKNQNALSAADIKNHIGTYTYGAYVRLGYSQIRYARTSNWTIAFHIPNGDVYVNQYQVDTIPAGQHYSYYNHYKFNYLFNYLLEAYGSVPAGRYYFTLYFDGQRSGQGSFTVNQ